MEAYEAVPDEFIAERDKPILKRKPGEGPRYHHLTLWVQNLTGWENLCALHTKSFTKEFKPFNQPLIDRVHLAEHSEGLMVGLGCLASKMNITLANDGPEAAYQTAKYYAETFPGRVYMELMANLPEQQAAIRPQRKIAERLGIPCIGDNDVHYRDKADGRENGAHHILVQARAYGKKEKEEESSDKSDAGYGKWYGCLTGDTPILTPHGAIPIADITTDHYVLGPNGDWNQVLKSLCTGEKLVFEVTLEDNIKIQATADHPFLSDQGFKSVDQLRVGDRLKIGHEINLGSSVKALATTMTDSTQGDKIPGWTIFKMVERDNMVDWQFIPSRSTDLTSKIVSGTYLMSQAPGPRESGIVHVGRALMRNLRARTQRFSDENLPFGRVSKSVADNTPDRLGMELHGLSNSPDTLPSPIQPSDLDTSDGVRHSTVRRHQIMLSHESTEGILRMVQAQLAPNLSISVAKDIEIFDILQSLPQLLCSLPRIFQSAVGRMALPIEVPSIPSGSISDTRADTATDSIATTTETQWSFGHKKIVAIRPIGIKTTFDLTVDRHCFLANGIFSHNCDEFFLKSAEEMFATGGFQRSDLEQTVELLDRVTFDFGALEEPAPPIAPVPNPGDDPEFDAFMAEHQYA